MAMLYITDRTINPYWNLAAEEYLFEKFSESVFRLWQNDNAIIVGRYQNTVAEIDADYVMENGISVVRRLTGGGAVFHDLGNLNFTFIENSNGTCDSTAMFKKFTAPIIAALMELGIKAELNGRNDLVIDGKKFSGNAVCRNKGRILQHGTLLFSTSIGKLAGALRNKPEKFSGKSVRSNRSRVTNISKYLKEPMSIDEFKEFLGDFVCNRYLLPSGEKIRPYEYSQKDMEAIGTLCREKYSTEWWNFNSSPKFGVHNCCKFKGGMVEICFEVENGHISNMKVFGDYFFSAPTEEFCNMLDGTEYNRSAVAERLDRIKIPLYFNHISREEIMKLFF